MVICKDVWRIFETGEARVEALAGVTFQIPQGQFTAITGPSGCGKSTLLHLLGGLDHPTRGEIFVNGQPLHNATEKDLTHYRRSQLGIVFQFFNLLPTMTVLENAELPLLLQRWPHARARARALELLELLGMAPRAHHFPHQLSGGQMQRAAIARALVHRPSLLLADEPTGNLDSASARTVLDALHTIAATRLTTLLVVTHSEDVAASAHRQIRLADGRLTSDSTRQALSPSVPSPGVE